MIVGRFFTLFGGPESAAKLINALSALASAFTIMFLFWTITHLAKKLVAEKETIKADLPDGFQRAEFLLEHGFLDFIVDRSDLKERLDDLLVHLSAA